MPEKEVVEQAKEDLKEGKSPSTAAGEFVHEEIEHVREGKHGARSPQQAIAIGLEQSPPRRYSSASTEGWKNQQSHASRRREGLP